MRTSSKMVPEYTKTIIYPNTEPRLSPLMFVATLTIGIYGSDLHKLMLSVISFAAGQPLMLTIHGRLADIVMVLLLTCLTITILIVHIKRLIVVFNIPGALMLFMGILATFSLFTYYDSSSVEWYYRFISGNLLLFFSAAIICRTPKNIRLVLLVWVTSSFIMSLSVIYLASIGVSWSSGRSEIIQGVGIRTGYFSALSIMYIVSKLLFNSKGSRYFFRFTPVLIILVLGCMASGAKASILLMLLGVSTIFLIKLIRFNSLAIGKSLAISSSIFIAVVIFISVLTNLNEVGLDVGFLSQDVDYSSYSDAFQSRINLALDYINYGSRHFLLGGGISSAYALDVRTHSALTAFFVQFGIVGIIVYLIWLICILLMASIKIVSSNFAVRPRGYMELLTLCLVSVVSLVAKAEITGDLPGNRELWLFCGMLLSLNELPRSRAARYHRYAKSSNNFSCPRCICL